MSVVASSLVPGVVGDNVLLVEERQTTVAVMFADERARFYQRLNLMRLVGMFLCYVGIFGIFYPFYYLLGYVPFIGGFGQSLFWFCELVLSVTLGFVVISLAWVFYHPEMLASILIGIGASLTFAGKTAGEIIAGKFVLVLSILPLVMWVMVLIEDCQFAREQRELDRQSSTGLTVSEGEKRKLLGGN
jgi:hypothetical protein